MYIEHVVFICLPVITPIKQRLVNFQLTRRVFKYLDLHIHELQMQL